MKTSKVVLTMLAAMMVAVSASAIVWNGAGGNMLWNNPANWVGGTIGAPQTQYMDVKSDYRTGVNGTLANPILYNSTIGSSGDPYGMRLGVGGANEDGTNYVKMVTGSSMRAESVLVGNNPWYAARLTIASGTKITNLYATGAFTVGAASQNWFSTLDLENGAEINHCTLLLNTKGTIHWRVGAGSVTTLGMRNAVTLNGEIRLDLANATAGTYTLINGDNNNVGSQAMTGAFITALNAQSGGVWSGLGNYYNYGQLLFVENAGTKGWSVSKSTDGEDLLLTVVPEPATMGLLLIGVSTIMLRRWTRKR